MDLYPEPGFISKQHYFFLLVLCACSGSFLLLWAVHKCIHVGSTTVAVFRREDLQAQRIRICDIIFNEILNTAIADMAGLASQCWLPRSHPGCDSKCFHPHVCPWNGFCPWASRTSRKWGVILWTPTTAPISLSRWDCSQFCSLSLGGKKHKHWTRAAFCSTWPAAAHGPRSLCDAFPSLCASQHLLLTKNCSAVTVSLYLQ